MACLFGLFPGSFKVGTRERPYQSTGLASPPPERQLRAGSRRAKRVSKAGRLRQLMLPEGALSPIS